MAEKGSQKLQFSSGLCPSVASRHRPVRVVHIQNPTVLKTTASEFREVVQFHTGQRKRSSRDGHESSRMKAPKLEGRSNYNFIPRRPEPAIAPMSNDGNIKHGNWGINLQDFKDDEAQSNQVSDILNSQIFDTLDNIGDGFLFGQFFPYPFYDECN